MKTYRPMNGDEAVKLLGELGYSIDRSDDALRCIMGMLVSMATDIDNLYSKLVELNSEASK